MTEPQGGPPFLDALRKRAPMLEALADGPTTQRALRDDLGVARSTVYKGLRELEAAGLVVDGDGGYRLTRMGRLAWRRHDAYLTRLRRLAAAERLLETVPADVHLPLSLFEHGHVHVPGRHAPERPLERLDALAETADRLRCLSPSGMPRYLSDIHERVQAGRQTATLVLERPALERLAADCDDYDAVRSTTGVELRRIEAELPFAVVLFDDDRLGLFGYDDGTLAGAVFADDETAVRWGERVFERHRARSEPA